MSSDHDAVRALLGRDPQGAYRVVARNRVGDPVVIENSPLLDDGTPMPTRYWLIGAEEQRAVGTLEGAGGVRRAEVEVDAAELADAHRRYADERDRAIPADHTGPRPSGGVGGTRTGVKCLHAHYAWFLAGGDDPVGRWVERQLASLHITVEAEAISIASPATTQRLPTGSAALAGEHFTADPPRPEDLTNAIGQISDLVEDLIQADPQATSRQVELDGPLAGVLAEIELGRPAPARHTVGRDDIEDLFRTLATERRDDRRHNPGVPASSDAAQLDELVGACCIIVAVVRQLHLDTITLVDRAAR